MNNKNNIEQNVKTENTNEPKIKVNKKITVGDEVLIKVKSTVCGKLIYCNNVSGEKYVWETCNDVQVMPMRELRAMKAKQIDFFRNQWVLIDGVADGEDCKATSSEICKILIIDQYYKDYINPSDFDEISKLDVSGIEAKVKMLSANSKENLIVALNQFIKNGKLDSIKKIKAFEKALDCELLNFE